MYLEGNRFETRPSYCIPCLRCILCLSTASSTHAEVFSCQPQPHHHSEATHRRPITIPSTPVTAMRLKQFVKHTKNQQTAKSTESFTVSRLMLALHNAELHDLKSSWNIIWVVKSEWDGWGMWHVWGKEKHIKGFATEIWEKIQDLKDICVNGGIILKQIIEEQNERRGLDWSGSG